MDGYAPWDSFLFLTKLIHGSLLDDCVYFFHTILASIKIYFRRELGLSAIKNWSKTFPSNRYRENRRTLRKAEL